MGYGIYTFYTVFNSHLKLVREMIKWGEFSKKVFPILYLRKNEYFLFFNLVTVTIFSHKSKSFTLNINHCTAINNVAQWFSTSSSSCYHYCLHVHLKALQQQNQLNFITFLFFFQKGKLKITEKRENYDATME